MSGWLISHFVNPGFVIPGMALVAAPILIHLLNRLRYRRVRFAAMEFLLQSEQQNRRRLQFEQWLLLLLRILAVVGLTLLLSRLILDSSQLSLVQGARLHHILLLDDSLSMQDRWGETSSLSEGLKSIQRLLGDGARRPNTQKFTLLLLSDPDRPIVSQRDINSQVVTEMLSRLTTEQIPGTQRALSLVTGLERVDRLLKQEKGVLQQVHVISDFREAEWKDQRALPSIIDTLTAGGARVNLIRTVGESHPNLTITRFSGASPLAAVGVPLRLAVELTNHSEQVRKDVRVAIFDNGVRLPVSLIYEQLEPQSSLTLETDIRLTTVGRHRLDVRIDADALEADNRRFLVVDVANAHPVLLVDGQLNGAGAGYIADALAADPQSTGISPRVDSVEFLRRGNLQDFRAIYLIDVPELPADALDAVERFVAAGGGLVWYLGPQIRPLDYTNRIYRDGEGLLPVPLANSSRELPIDITSSEVDLIPADHPIFAILAGSENPFLASVHVRRYWGPAADWERDDQRRRDQVATICRLRTGDPLVLEHRFGQGRVVTVLTSADPEWTDWPQNPSFVVYQLDLLQRIARRDQLVPERIVGEPIELLVDPARFSDAIEIELPADDGPRVIKLRATAASPGDPADSPGTKTAEESSSPSAESPATSSGATPESAAATNGTSMTAGSNVLRATFRETEEPGVYLVRRMGHGQPGDEQILTYNTPTSDSNLELATTDKLRERIGPNRLVTIQEPGAILWVDSASAGSEIRTLLLWGLLGLLFVEQWLASRLSYHLSDSAPTGRRGGGSTVSPARTGRDRPPGSERLPGQQFPGQPAADQRPSRSRPASVS